MAEEIVEPTETSSDQLHKSYYAIIPADVRYHLGLSGDCKLLYGEITALCNERGYCWATNGYFADLYDVDERTVRRWIELLRDNGFINVEFNAQFNRRKLSVMERGGQKCPTLMTKMSGGADKNVRHNITSNNTSNNTLTKRKSRNNKASRIPEDWQPSDHLISWANLRTPDVIIANETFKFKNYYESLSGAKATKLDWGKTWQNWMLTAQERNGNRGGGKSNAQKTQDAGDEAIRQMRSGRYGG